MQHDHAIVIGSSMAGLLAARVLSDRFERVTVIERDAVPEGADVRKGVPQGAHAHGLLARGQQAIEELFPGISKALVDGGAVEGDIGTLLRFWQYGTWKLLVEMGVRGSFQSRPFLEMHVRRRVAALPNVKVVAGKVTGLLASAKKDRVTGVRLERAAGGAEDLAASFVVDASGRGSHAPAWLEELGYAPPKGLEVKVGVGYATRVFRRAPGETVAMIVVPEAPRERRFGVAFPIEGDRFIVTLGGWLKDHPPTEEAAWLDFARSLPVPDIHDLVRDREALGPIGVHKFPASVRHVYEGLARSPEAFVVVGDAVCSFNPVYGQGMTVASLEALALRDTLAEAPDLSGVARAVQKKVGKIVNDPWMLAVGEDFRWPETEGKRGPETNVVNAYIAKVHRLAGADPEIVRAFYRVMHMLAPPTSMFHPRIVWRALRGKPRRFDPPPHVSTPVAARDAAE